MKNQSQSFLPEAPGSWDICPPALFFMLSLLWRARAEGTFSSLRDPQTFAKCRGTVGRGGNLQMREGIWVERA